MKTKDTGQTTLTPHDIGNVFRILTVVLLAIPTQIAIWFYSPEVHSWFSGGQGGTAMQIVFTIALLLTVPLWGYSLYVGVKGHHPGKRSFYRCLAAEVIAMSALFAFLTQVYFG